MPSIMSSIEARSDSYPTVRFIPGLCHRNALIQIHILDRVQNFHAICHRALEGFAARNESRPTRALIDHSCSCGLSKIVLTGCPTAVDETHTPHVAVRHLVTAQVNGMVTSQLAVDAFIQLAIRNT